MPTEDESKNKNGPIHFSCYISPQVHAAIQGLMAYHQISATEVLRRSVSWYEIISHHAVMGDQLIVRKADGTSIGYCINDDYSVIPPKAKPNWRGRLPFWRN